MTRLFFTDEGRSIAEPNPWLDPAELGEIMDDPRASAPQPWRGPGTHLSVDDDEPSGAMIWLGVALFVASAMFLTWLGVAV